VTDTEQTQAIRASLERWATYHYEPNSRIDALARLPGHSGISYGFDVVSPGYRDRLVIRVPPAGVRRKNSTDVLRFVPVLQMMTAEDIPVPAVRWYGSDERWFGVPYLIVQRVPGSTLPDVFDSSAPAPPAKPVVIEAFRKAIEILAAIHDVDAHKLIRDRWSVPTSQQADLDMWIPLLRKVDDESLIDEGLQLRQRLMDKAPSVVRGGVVHGDFYSNNWMFDGSELTAVLDWENSTLGPRMWDVGWLATIYDPACWGPMRADNMSWTPSPEKLLEWYEHASGQPLESPDWYRALMCYRLACITPVNLRLHRTGRRVDPIWEVFGEAMPRLFGQARELLKNSS